MAGSAEFGPGAEDSTFPTHAMDARININAEARIKMIRGEKCDLITEAASQMEKWVESESHADSACIPILQERLKL